MKINEIGQKLIDWIDRHNKTTSHVWKQVNPQTCQIELIYNPNVWFDETVGEFIINKRDFWVSAKSKDAAVEYNEMWSLIYFDEEIQIIHAGYAQCLKEIFDYFQIDMDAKSIFGLEELMKASISENAKEKSINLQYRVHQENEGIKIKGIKEGQGYWQLNARQNSMTNNNEITSLDLNTLFQKKGLDSLIMKLNLDEKLNISQAPKKQRKI